MNINDLMGDLGITPEPERKPEPPRSPTTRRKRQPANDSTEATPKPLSKRAKALRDKRIERAYYATCSGIQIDILDISRVFAAGVQALEQGADEAGLRRSIRDFVETIRKDAPWENQNQPRVETPTVARQETPRAVLSAWDSLMAHKPDGGFRFCHGISRTGAPYAFWSPLHSADATSDLSYEAKQAWKACQGEATRDAIDYAWRARRASDNRLSAQAVLDLQSRYHDARKLDAQERSGNPRQERRQAPKRPQEPAARQAQTQAPVITLAPDPIERDAETIGQERELDAAFGDFRVNRDLDSAARLQKAMGAFLRDSS